VRDETRFAYRRHYRLRPWSDCVEVHWGRRAQVYVTPVGASEICVAVISRDPRLRLPNALDDFPVLATRLEHACASSSGRGGITCMLRLRRASRGHVALAGDAAGCVDAISGEGLGLAFQQAEVLAQALAAGNLGQYEAAHGRIMRRASGMASSLLFLDARRGAASCEPSRDVPAFLTASSQCTSEREAMVTLSRAVSGWLGTCSPPEGSPLGFFLDAVQNSPAPGLSRKKTQTGERSPWRHRKRWRRECAGPQFCWLFL
jgi:hypothetical protein